MSKQVVRLVIEKSVLSCSNIHINSFLIEVKRAFPFLKAFLFFTDSFVCCIDDVVPENRILRSEGL